MSPFEYLLLLAAVVLGLAISDLAVSTHRLLNAAGRVRWDALAPLAACLAFVRIVTQWWTWYGADGLASRMTFGMFVGVLVSAGLLFLMAAAALPDEIGEEGINLRVHYRQVARRYWLLFAAQWTVLNGVSAWAQASIGGAHLNFLSPASMVLPLSLLLAFVRVTWVQAIGLIGFLLLYIVSYFATTLA